jgi:cell division protein FtsQ
MDGDRRKLRSVAIGDGSAFVRQDYHFSSHFLIFLRLAYSLLVPLNEVRERLARLMGDGRAGAFTCILFICSIFLGLSQGGSGEALLGYFSASVRQIVFQTGFTVRSITVSGLSSLDIVDVLDTANVDRSLPLFLINIDSLRERLSHLPLVRGVSIRKFYPDGLSVGVVEASPEVLWQVNGSVFVASRDGQLIAPLREAVDGNIPLVVGADAGPHIPEFLAMLSSAPELRDCIKAGVWVGGRRWTLNMTNGVDVFLPEGDVSSPLERLMSLIHDRHVLDAAIVSIDLRQSDRVTLGLSDSALLGRIESQKQKNKVKGVRA